MIGVAQDSSGGRLKCGPPGDYLTISTAARLAGQTLPSEARNTPSQEHAQ